MQHQGGGLSEYLKQDFAQRRIGNPRYSLRSYAKLLAISPSHLSQIFSNKRKVKAQCAFRIAASLGLTPTEAVALFRRESGERDVAVEDSARYLSESEFSPISEWFYYAILGLAAVRPNVADSRWIARRLGLPPAVAEKAFAELIAHKHIEITYGQFRQCSRPLRTAHDVPSSKVRRYHKQNLQLAIEKIDRVAVESREYASMTMAIHPRRLKAAKEMIRKFKEEFSAEMGHGKKSEVYNLCIQFFPLTETREGKA